MEFVKQLLYNKIGAFKQGLYKSQIKYNILMLAFVFLRLVKLT